jgi:carbamoyltransferase
MLILGVNSGPHDGSAALLRDGELVAMVEQERLSRRKHALGESPADAIAACLRIGGVMLDDVDVIAVGWDMLQMWGRHAMPRDRAAYDAWLLPPEQLPRAVTPPIAFIRHHEAHAASALWMSGLDRAVALVMDGSGEGEATTISVATGSGLSRLAEWDISQSLGNFYGLAAEWAGFSFWGPGKLMGLAPYGRPIETMPLHATPMGYAFANSRPPHPLWHRRFLQHRALLLRCFRDLYPFSPGDGSEAMAYARFAASVQDALEQAIFQLVRIARERTGADTIVLAGGVALNCTFNGKLARSGLFRDVFVPPFPHDAGVGLGAALIVDRQRRGDEAPSRRLPHAYWGESNTPCDVDAALGSIGLPARRLAEAELTQCVAAHLAAGHTIGWSQGRAEVGPRALGARSILADPRQRRHLVHLNHVKGREVWRPLAPSVQVEYADALFAGDLPAPTDFMLAACQVRPEAQRLVPACVHVDGSARPQAVRRETNPRFWRLIDEFRRLTNTPAVINTSFNLAGEPIVYSPADAASSFCRSELDVLVLDDVVVEKPSATLPASAAGPR